MEPGGADRGGGDQASFVHARQDAGDADGPGSVAAAKRGDRADRAAAFHGAADDLTSVTLDPGFNHGADEPMIGDMAANTDGHG